MNKCRIFPVKVYCGYMLCLINKGKVIYLQGVYKTLKEARENIEKKWEEIRYN